MSEMFVMYDVLGIFFIIAFFWIISFIWRGINITLGFLSKWIKIYNLWSENYKDFGEIVWFNFSTEFDRSGETNDITITIFNFQLEVRV